MRKIAGLTDWRGSVVMIASFTPEGEGYGRIIIFPESAGVWRSGLSCVRSCPSGRRDVGVATTREGSKIDIALWCFRYSGAQEAALLIGRRRKNTGAPLGRPIALQPAELEGLERALDWLEAA